MADALLSSTAVFRSRAAELNMEEAAIAKAVDEKIGSLGAFGFCTKYVSGIFLS